MNGGPAPHNMKRVEQTEKSRGEMGAAGVGVDTITKT